MNIFKRFSVLFASCAFILFESAIFANTFDFGVIGDAGYWDQNTQSVHDSLLRKQIKNLVLPGDNIYADPILYPSYESVWDKWFKEGFNFDVVAIGNHNKGYPEEIAYFKMPAESYAVTQNELVEFIVLNSNNENTADTQAAFLEQILSKTTAPFVFLVYHHPTYSLTLFHMASEKEKFQDAVRPILFKYKNKITALIVGHDHMSIIAHFNDLPVILSGSTHEQWPHVALNYTLDGITVKTNWFNDNNALWAHLILNSDSKYAQVDFVRGTDDRVMCSAMIQTGYAATLMQNCLQ